MRLEIDIPEHHYNNIMALDSVSLGRAPYKGIIMYAINAIKQGKVLVQEPTTKNDLEVEYYKQNIKAYAHDFGVSEEQAEKELRVTIKNDLGVEEHKGEVMDFPNTFDEFADYYGFKDKEEVYTNGSELIQVYRVKQWLEHISTTMNDLGVDCIDRAKVQTEIEMNASRYTIAKERGGMGQVEWSDQLIKVSDAVDIIRHMPLVTPQEPKTGHWGWLRCDMYVCSECKNVYTDLSGTKDGMNYCPNCGAKMAESEET